MAEREDALVSSSRSLGMAIDRLATSDTVGAFIAVVRLHPARSDDVTRESASCAKYAPVINVTHRDDT